MRPYVDANAAESCDGLYLWGKSKNFIHVPYHGGKETGMYQVRCSEEQVSAKKESTRVE